ncbi:DUF924 domain-containing protein [Sphingomonas panacisoli]|uniref:DUF924 domain-containing protein n=1 Tax=Sphingomonas panacisoli TaxID=1813879 RepID=A0A5B8LI65_9SPHN|nr:DUF924 family protein [Sphingomonas panacisoli]QDZ07332.1 DUF924 domain-containing protein [Sphingomonas panacisoli]
MAGDLEVSASQVHDKAREVLHFWLDETPTEKRFAKDEELDAEIRERFGALRDAVLASDAKGWTDDPVDLLGAIILLDQFSRNMHRDTLRAFEADKLALRLAKEAVAKGWDLGMTGLERQFVYLPFEHSERMDDQRESVRLFTDLGDAETLRYAHAHKAVIDRFGRFPSRNAALGRASTPEEEDYLSQPGAGW